MTRIHFTRKIRNRTFDCDISWSDWITLRCRVLKKLIIFNVIRRTVFKVKKRKISNQKPAGTIKVENQSIFSALKCKRCYDDGHQKKTHISLKSIHSSLRLISKIYRYKHYFFLFVYNYINYCLTLFENWEAAWTQNIDKIRIIVQTMIVYFWFWSLFWYI